MAKRPIFIPDPNGPPYVKVVELEFKWYPGFAKSQATKINRFLTRSLRTARHLSDFGNFGKINIDTWSFIECV